MLFVIIYWYPLVVEGKVQLGLLSRMVCMHIYETTSNPTEDLLIQSM